MDAVNHPAHYNRPGQKECIVQMEDGCTVDDNGFCVFFDGEEYE